MAGLRWRWEYAVLATLFLLILRVSGAFGRSSGQADLVLLNGTIVTVEEDRPVVDAVAVRGGVILAVGSREEIRPTIGRRTKVIDLEGQFAMPGFIEGHGHFMMLGRSRMQLDLKRAGNWDEVVSMVQGAVRNARPGEWISGSGWHQEKWDKVPSPSFEGYPSHRSLTRATPRNPVILVHASGHAAFANAKAMELAGVGRNTPDPEGGRIVRDSEGNPVGVFLDAAQELLTKAREKALAGRSAAEVKDADVKAIDLASRECLSKGVTTFQDAGSSFETIDVFKGLAEKRALKIRLWIMIRESNEQLVKRLAEYRLVGVGNRVLTVRAIKRFMDGALGSRTAWLLEPYSDLPSSTGLNVEPPGDILETARIAIKNGFQLCVHAIGDRANRETLNIFETVLKADPEKKDSRWRIEHAQHLDPADIPRFAEWGIIASMQAIHCTSDAPWVVKRLGETRAGEGAYVWRRLIQSGAMVALGTDTPVEDIDPLANFHAAVTRKLPDGSAFFPAQRMSRMEALRAYTINNAHAAFEEDTKGSLKPGKLADIVVLSDDILTIPEDEIPGVKVLYTILGGKVVYRGKRVGESSRKRSHGAQRQGERVKGSLHVKSVTF